MSIIDDHFYLQQLTVLYAQAVDRRDSDLLVSLLSVDAELIAPGVNLSGSAELAGITPMLAEMFECTQHRVFNQTFKINGDTASGETYCSASHIRLSDGGERELEEWAIRYQDKFVKNNGQWLFQRRELLIDWVEVRPAMAFGEQFD